MSSDQKPLEEMIRELPLDSQTKVREFVQALRDNANGRNKKLDQKWAGALIDFRDKYTSRTGRLGARDSG
jgi:hypothetical protein